MMSRPLPTGKGSVGVKGRISFAWRRELLGSVASSDRRYRYRALGAAEGHAKVLQRQHAPLVGLADTPIRMRLRAERQHLHDRRFELDTKPLQQLQLFSGLGRKLDRE